MAAKKLYTDEELKLHRKIYQQNKIKNQTPEQKELKRSKQAEWNKNNPDKIASYRFKNKIAINENSKKWQKKNREKSYEVHRKWRERNKDKLREKARIDREKNKDEKLLLRRIKSKERKLKDPIFKFSENIRSLISISFKKQIGIKKSLKTETILGCSLDFFREYILSLCPEGVTLKDFGKYGYHIDHILPISLGITEEDVIKLNHYTNLRPLWWKDNIQKSNKII